jgi:hypothetical protein
VTIALPLSVNIDAGNRLYHGRLRRVNGATRAPDARGTRVVCRGGAGDGLPRELLPDVVRPIRPIWQPTDTGVIQAVVPAGAAI